MRRAGLCVLTAWFVTAALMPGRASSHREAPLIAQDPMADDGVNGNAVPYQAVLPYLGVPQPGNR